MAPMKSTALTVAAAMTMTTLPIENYPMETTGREAQCKKSWNVDCTPTCSIYGDW